MSAGTEFHGSDGDDRVYHFQVYHTLGRTYYLGKGDDWAWTGKGADTHYGGEGNDWLDGRDGDDTLYGGRGNDRLEGGRGDDTLYGGGGDDFLDGDDGDDTVYGGRGNDTFKGSFGMNRLYGGKGDDTYWTAYGSINSYHFFRGDGSDLVYKFVRGEDIIVFEDAAGRGITFDRLVIRQVDSDTVITGWGRDGDSIRLYETDASTLTAEDFKGLAGENRAYLEGGEGDDTLTGGDGDDWITGYGGNDTIKGGDGNDRLVGANGSDTLYGGNDILIAGPQHGLKVTDRDALYGGKGDDLLIGSGRGKNYYHFQAGDGADTIKGFNPLWDHIVFDDAAERGVAFDDLRFDQVGEDTVITGYGLDGDSITLKNVDLINLLGQFKSVTRFEGLAGGVDWKNIMGGDGDDTLKGGDEDEWIFGARGNDTLHGGGGRDNLIGYPGNDKLNGNGGNDILIGDSGDDKLLGGKGNDMLYGGWGNDKVAGGNGDDRVYGNQGNDKLYGGNGDDELYGGDGDDKLNGEKGNDTLQGGAGADRFIFDDESETDTILDFDPGEDFIVIRGGLKFDDLEIKQDGDDAKISGPADDFTIVLQDFDASKLGVEDFEFMA